MPEIPTRTTLRLTLRPFNGQDLEPLHRILGEADILRYFPRPEAPSRDQVERMISGQLDHWQEYGLGWWAVVSQPEGNLIGWCGLQFLPETQETEVGYLLSKAHWGQGLATEAARTSLQFGFDGLGIESIVAIVHPENAASRRVIEKLGMAFTEQTEYFGMDCCRYELDRLSYLATKATGGSQPQEQSPVDMEPAAS